MTRPQLQISADAAALATSVAQELLSRLAQAQSEGRRPHLGLTGGTIANVIYREVARLGPASAVNWSEVVFWWGDERFVAEDSPDRNAGQAKAAFLAALPIPDANIHPMPSTGSAATADGGAAAYAELLRAEGTGEFEVLLLGVGPDGHIASLFPGFPQLERLDTIAVGVQDSPKPPPERITLTLPALNRSREVWFLASGAEKAWAVSTAYTQSLREESLVSAEESLVSSQESLPAARVNGTVATLWFLDRAAASAIG
jgi:6-phosphogluconolactonase